jgi:O-methyltransferase
LPRKWRGELMSLSPQEVYDSLHIVRGARLPTQPGGSHTVIIPGATYSPWLDDPTFIELFQALRSNTLVDHYRLFELWNLVGQTSSVPGDILEIGVWRGGSGCLMARRAPERTVFLCDTFSGVVKVGDNDATYRGGEHSDTSVDIVKDLATSLNVRNIELLRGIFPDQTGDQIADRKFSFCHIDVDVYLSAKHIRDWVWPRLSVGGIVVYDDYGFSPCDGVTRYVNEMVNLAGSITIQNLNGHAVVVKTA